MNIFLKRRLPSTILRRLAPLNHIFLADFGLNHIFRSDTPSPLGGSIGSLAERDKMAQVASDPRYFADISRMRYGAPPGLRVTVLSFLA